MNKPGVIVMIFADPFKLQHPIGQARLKMFLRDVNQITEEWEVEYLDDEGQFYTAQVRRDEINGKK